MELSERYNMYYKSAVPESLALSAISQARADERKRCATIAENYVELHVNNFSVQQCLEMAHDLSDYAYSAWEKYGPTARVSVAHPLFFPSPMSKTTGMNIADLIKNEPN